MSADRKLPTTRQQGRNHSLQSLHPSTKPSYFLALPAARVRFPARFCCQGRTLRSRERKLRGLDSACGKAPGTATKGICFFFSSGNHAWKKEERRNKCQRDNTPLGENYCGRRSKSRGECSKLTPPFIITASETPCLRWNSARGATCNRGHSIPTTDGLNGNGKSAKEKKESPFACLCRSRKPLRPMASKTRQPNRRLATPSGLGRIGLC